MTTIKDFTDDEWQLILLAPTQAATYIMTADMSVMGAFREMKAMMKAMLELQPAPAAQELVSSVIEDIQTKSKNKEKIEAPEGKKGEDPREPARQGLQQAAALLDQKCSAEEAIGYKQWVAAVAQAVAEADKEGSHFGMGGVRVSDKEKTALAEINTYLGL